MKKNRKKRMRRGLAILLAAALIGNTAGVSASAQNDFTDGTEAALQSESGTVSEPADEPQALPAEAPAETETAPVKEPVETETQPAEIPTETPQAETCICTVVCTCQIPCMSDDINTDCPVCGAEGTNLAECKGVYQAEVTQWVTDPNKLTAASIEHVEVKQIPVSISAQPQDKTVYYSQWTEKLEVTAQTVDGAGPVSYQWYRVGTGADGGDEAISGAAEDQFWIPGDLDAGTYKYYCIATCDGYPAKSNTATVTVLQSGIEMGEIKTYLKRYLIPEEQTVFTGGQTIMVKVTPKATGMAPAAMARTAAAEPAAGQMALYDAKGNQIGPAVDASSGTYTMEVGSTELGMGTHVLTVKYVGGLNTASAEGTVEVTVVSAARIGSREFLMLEEAWEYAKENSSEGNPVTVTLLSDVEVSSELTVESGEHIILTSETDKNYTLSGIVDGNRGTIRMSGGSFELLGGTVNAKGTGYGIFLLGGSAFLRGGSIIGHHGIYLEEHHADARIEIFNGFVMDTNYGIEAYNAGELVINGGQMEAGTTCVYVSGNYGTDGVTVRICGGIMQSTRSGYGLEVRSGFASVELSGGTFIGSSASPSISASASSNVKSILAEGKAYYRGGDTTGELITEGLEGTELSGTVTVGDCVHWMENGSDKGDGTCARVCAVCGREVIESHRMTAWADQKDGTHSRSCSVCGYTETAEHTWNGSGLDCPDCQITFAASVEVNGKEALFSTIEQAWAYAKEKSSEENAAAVTLLADATVSECLTVENGSHILFTCPEGAEHTLSGTIQISGGTFELAGGTIRSTEPSAISVVRGRAILRGGTVIGEKNSGVYLQPNANNIVVEINSGCTISGKKYGVYESKGQLRVRGGRIAGDDVGVYVSMGEAKISGGIIEGGSVGLRVAGNTCSVNLSGGTYKAKDSYSIWCSETNYTSHFLTDFLGDGYGYYDADGQYIAVKKTTRELTQKEVTVKKQDAVAYTITIPKTAIAGGDAVAIGINKEQNFNLNGGAVNVSVSGGIEDGKLTLTDKANAENTVTSALYVLKAEEAEEQPVTSYENGVLASFTNMNDPAVSLSFKEPAEINIPAGTYEGIVTFSVDYTEAQQ